MKLFFSMVLAVLLGASVSYATVELEATGPLNTSTINISGYLFDIPKNYNTDDVTEKVEKCFAKLSDRSHTESDRTLATTCVSRTLVPGDKFYIILTPEDVNE